MGREARMSTKNNIIENIYRELEKESENNLFYFEAFINHILSATHTRLHGSITVMLSLQNGSIQYIERQMKEVVHKHKIK